MGNVMKYFHGARLPITLIVIGLLLEVAARKLGPNATPGSFFGAGGAYDNVDTAVGFGNVFGSGVDVSPGIEIMLIGVALYAYHCM